MSSDLQEFMNGMDGPWEVISIEKDDKKFRVYYRSLTVSGLTWSHRTEKLTREMRVGLVGRIGFISQ